MSDTKTRVVALIGTLYGPTFGQGVLGRTPDLDTRLDAALIDDLKLDSLDLVELTMATEDEFGVAISDDEAEAFGPRHNGEGKTIRDWAGMVDAKLGAKAVAA